MFNKMRDMAQVLNETVHHLGQVIVNKFSLQEPQAINHPHQVSSGQNTSVLTFWLKSQMGSFVLLSQKGMISCQCGSKFFKYLERENKIHKTPHYMIYC